MAYVIEIINRMMHHSLYWSTTHEADYVFTPDATHLMEFKLWEPILILDNKNQFTESCKILGYYSGPAPNKVTID